MGEGNVCVIGIWHLGAVTSACLAELGYQVVGVDSDTGNVDALNSGRPPLYEPGLEELLAKNLASGRLRYTTGLSEALAGVPYVLMTYDTPVNERDEVDLTEIFSTTEKLAGSMEPGATFIISSQVPVGTCEKLAGTIREVRPSLAFGIAYVPENLRLGQAIQRFLNPEMLVIGTDTNATLEQVEALLSVIRAPRVTTDLRTAEMVKHAINGYLATCISFTNELAGLCDLVGADSLKVVEALRLDSRVSPKAPLMPGSGFSGGTLARDVKVLRGLGQQHGYRPPLFEGVWEVNQWQNGAPVRRLKQVYPSLEGRVVTVLGLTYKPGTSTLRRSVALEVIRDLVAAGARVQAYDPKANPEELENCQGFTACSSVEDAARGSDALLLMTAWPEFKELDFTQIGVLMKSRVLVDAHNFLDGEALVRQGFLYLGIGRRVRPTEAKG